MFKVTGGLSPRLGRRQLLQRNRAFIKATLMVAAVGGALGLAVRTPLAETAAPPDPQSDFASLKSMAVPGPSPEVLAQYIANKPAAIQLGKALFWDTKVGSDNKTACASCHHHAGADHRITNQLSPGLLAGDKTFQLGGPNYTLKAEDFPFTKHLFVDQARPQLSDINDVVGSQGLPSASLTDISRTTGPADVCANVPDDVFHGGSGFNINGTNTRQVTGRNTPTVINAVFNFRNFWDGRANNMFNGGDPFGMRNPNALVWKVEAGVLRQVQVAIPSSALASQSVGPPLSAVEMSCAGRSFMKLGKKLLPQVPLSGQAIAPNDSVLAPLAALRARNAQPTYAELIKKAFLPEYWASPAVIGMTSADGARFAPMDLLAPRTIVNDLARYRVSQMEANFALFFGLAIQLYESTLIANDTPYDRYLEGKTDAMTPQQVRGFKVFVGNGRCINCHGGAELTHASFSNVTRVRLERMAMGNFQQAIYDDGFYNIGVRPTADDLGAGGKDPFGNPLSETRMVQIGKTQLLGNGFDPVMEASVSPGQRVAVDGAFKVPGLRNVEFTGPYFHNGGKATLMQVVDFYNRGGDFADVNRDNLAPDIAPIGLTEFEKQDLVAFLLALSDDRVRYKKAPFDHPSICFNHGHPVDASGALIPDGTTGKATDNTQCLPAVGAGGLSTGLTTFLNLSPYRH